MRIRPMQADDAPSLGEIAQRAKAHWGYSASDLSRWQAELAAPANRRAQTFVAEGAGGVLGWVSLLPDTPRFVLEHLWVDPAAMGQGVGSALLAQAFAVARDAGAAGLTIDADPHAADFYRRAGAVRVGALAAPIAGQERRVRPQFILDALATPTTPATPAAPAAPAAPAGSP